jgi:hypothetical protein
MATITDIVVEGGGIRVSYDDNSIDQFTIEFNNGTITLFRNGVQAPFSAIRNIIDTIGYNSSLTSLYAHLFGVSADHIMASATGQIGSALTADTWSTIIWDQVELESHNGVAINSNGIISLPFGEWDIDARAEVYDNSGATASVVALHVLDVDRNSEVQFSFASSSIVAKLHGPKSISTATQLDLTDLSEGEVRRIAVQVRSDKSTTVHGIHADFLPSGSENHAGLLRISRIG